MTGDASEYGVWRLRMVEEQLVGRGLRDEETLAALRSVPRHLFVPDDLAAEAYADSPLPIGFGQTISQPYMVALMTSLLSIDVRSRVLEIGAGSGYQTAVLAEAAGEVFALERLAPLAERARATLARLGYQNVRLAIGDGTRGWHEVAPFDGILVAAAAGETPRELLAQLADGGRLVIPLGRMHGDQVLTIVERHGDEFTERRDTPCRFVPLLRDAEPEERAAAALSKDHPRKTAKTGGRREATMKAVDARVSGTVQGVYYRASARREGTLLGLRGWVRNVSDGSVALHIEGEQTAVDALLDWCRTGPPGARVSRVEVSDAPPDDAVDGFEVR